jgi:hypothetical protein
MIREKLVKRGSREEGIDRLEGESEQGTNKASNRISRRFEGVNRGA